MKSHRIKQSRQSAMVIALRRNSWSFIHRGIMGMVMKTQNGYQAGNIRVGGKDVGLPMIHGTHKTINDAIHNAWQHTMWHMSKDKK